MSRVRPPADVEFKKMRASEQGFKIAYLPMTTAPKHIPAQVPSHLPTHLDWLAVASTVAVPTVVAPILMDATAGLLSLVIMLLNFDIPPSSGGFVTATYSLG